MPCFWMLLGPKSAEDLEKRLHFSQKESFIYVDVDGQLVAAASAPFGELVGLSMEDSGLEVASRSHSWAHIDSKTLTLRPEMAKKGLCEFLATSCTQRVVTYVQSCVYPQGALEAKLGKQRLPVFSHWYRWIRTDPFSFHSPALRHSRAQHGPLGTHTLRYSYFATALLCSVRGRRWKKLRGSRRTRRFSQTYC